MSRLIRSTITLAAAVGLAAAALVGSPTQSVVLAADGSNAVTVEADPDVTVLEAPDDSSPSEPAPDTPAPDEPAPETPAADEPAPDEPAPEDGAPEPPAPEEGAPDEPLTEPGLPTLPPIDEWPPGIDGWTMSVAIDDLETDGRLQHEAYLTLTRSADTPGGLTSPYVAVRFDGIDQSIIDWFADQEDPVDADVVIRDEFGAIVATIALVDLQPTWLDIDLTYGIPSVVLTFEGENGLDNDLEPFSVGG